MSSSSSTNNDDNERPPAIFDVGGTKYSIEWHVLERYPTSLLTTSAQVALMANNDTVAAAAAADMLNTTTPTVMVTLDRGAASFPSLLQYLRRRPPAAAADDDEEFWLLPPLTLAEFRQDMDYFGIDLEECTVRSGADLLMCAQQADPFFAWHHKYVQSLHKKKEQVELELECADLIFAFLVGYPLQFAFGYERTWQTPRDMKILKSSHRRVYNGVQNTVYGDSNAFVVFRAMLQKYGLCIVSQNESGRIFNESSDGEAVYICVHTKQEGGPLRTPRGSLFVFKS